MANQISNGVKYSKLFGRTSKTVSANMKLASNKYLHQAWFIRESAAGRYYYLPFGIIFPEQEAKNN